MDNIVNASIICLFQLFSFTYVTSTIEKKRANYKELKTYVLYTILLLLMTLTYIVFDNMLRSIVMFAECALIFKIIFNIKGSTSIMDCFICYIISAISELVESILIFFVFNLPDNIINNYFINKPLGCIISLIIVITITKIFQNIKIKKKKSLDKEKVMNLIWIIIITLASFLSLYINNNELNTKFIITTISCSLIILIILFLFKEIIDKNELKSEYDKLFNYTENTESLLSKYQKYNHENKNQLILIRETLKSKNKTEELINEILEDDIEHTNKWLNELKNIPSGGLKGFLSYKINNMTDNGINVYLSISPRLKELNLSKAFNMKTYKELCQMIGVYMDNAYEASIETEEKNVALEMFYQDGTINFVISNTFNENINLDKIDEAGYSTKGKERGIGLSLVKDIVEKNNKINVNREVIQNYYYQHITVNVSN